MKTHQEKFRDARFAAMQADNDADRVKHLTAAIDELGYVIDELSNIGRNAHVRIEGEQERIAKLEDSVRRIPRGGPYA